MENLRAILGEPVSYRLSGVALDEFCKGVPDVAVTFVEETLAGPDKGKDEAPVTVYTDERGTYRFDRLLPPADRRSVRRLLYARKAGYGAWGYDLDTTGGQATGQIRLPVEEKVSGVVKNESGEPIAGATVALHSGWNRWGSFSFPPAWQNLAPQATTQADGSFTLGELPTESDVVLRVRARGYAEGRSPHVRTGRFGSYALRQADGKTIVLGSGGADANAPLTITLQRAVTLRGAVAYEGTGRPAPGICVATQGKRDSEWSEAVTDSQGRFEMTGVAPVPCNLLVLVEDAAPDVRSEWTAAALSLDDLQPGEIRDGLRLILTKGEIVRGRATDAQGHPLKGIDVAFYSAARPRPGAACQSILTSADGAWSYRFPPGEVSIYVRTSFPGAGWEVPRYTYTVVAGGAIENVDFRLNQSVPENSPHRGVATAAAGQKDRQPTLPRGTIPGPMTPWLAAQGGNGHYYQAVRMPKPLPWKEANRLAGEMGGYLVTITSKAENDFVFRLVDDDAYWYHGYNWRGPWIGAVQPSGSAEPAGGWSWVTGEAFTYALWDQGQPNNFSGTQENRLVFGNQRARIPTWNDVVEDFPEVVSFVVEWNDPQVVMTVWPVSAGGNGHWYRVVHVPAGLMWNDANEAARAEGGYLATITSAEENAFVFSLIQDPIYWNGPRGPWIGGFQRRATGRSRAGRG